MKEYVFTADARPLFDKRINFGNEDWNDGIMEYWNIPSFQHSIIPFSQRDLVKLID